MGCVDRLEREGQGLSMLQVLVVGRRFLGGQLGDGKWTMETERIGMRATFLLLCIISRD